ncbi:MAG: SufD family Fe-S cluster assembly protein [Candidatus Abawacabacteria bacterium]|nr:SufD family Fe-S cluster assembly protein [Candidatus Abawacabacteria bacterium]
MDKELSKQIKKQQYGLGIFALLPAISDDHFSAATYHIASKTTIQSIPLIKAGKKFNVLFDLNTAFAATIIPKGILAKVKESAILIHVPANTKAADAYTVDIDGFAGFSIGCVCILVEASSDVHIIIKHTQATSQLLVHTICEANAKLSLVHLTPQYPQPYHYYQHNIIQTKAQYSGLELIRNADLVQSHVTTQLAGAESAAFQGHIDFGSRESKHDLFVGMHHEGAGSTSEMLSKVILRDRSHTVYRSMIKITEDADKVSGQQKEQTLLLSPQARIDAIPMLDITNDSVSCSHSASMSNLDQEQLFYLQSRGFSYEQAESLIVQGFYSDVLKYFSNLALCALIHDYTSPLHL